MNPYTRVALLVKNMVNQVKRNRPHVDDLWIVFDIDHTLLLPLEDGTVTGIKPMIDLLSWLKDEHLRVALITSRVEQMRNITIQQLEMNRIYDWDILVMRPYGVDDFQTFKSSARRDIQHEYCGGRSCILANIGDQETDLMGGYSHYTFKLPSPY